MASVVTLVPFGDGAVALLSRWLVAPHVARWYPEPQEHLNWAVNPPIGGERALIAADGDQVGYLRWQVVSREVLDLVGLHDIPENSVDIDILIGEEKTVGRGVGPLALQKLVAHLQTNPAIPLLGLTTSIHNYAAQRAFRKAGFSILRQYDPPGYGHCHLMVKNLALGNQ
ncbi:GNAT family N-acetyltransferase [Scytonema tolypothrichoides VB-61278]|nr:GNAT family N-acetyltransferase [Scytonema tolypothrichoides VB-61278]